MVSESWFRNLWRNPRKHDASEKVVIGVLAFEVASLMSKLVHMWQSLNDKQVARSREEITNSVGIKKLVSDDDDYIVGLICVEMVENMGCVAKSVARLARKCNDPNLKNFELVFGEWMKVGADPHGWAFSSKKMDKKVKKMEWFISVNATLYQEMELLTDLEQTLRRMKNIGGEQDNLIEFQKKVAWKQHVVKNLQDISPWNRTYDYMVHLLARSLFTIFGRIKHVFGVNETLDVNESGFSDSDFIDRSQSVSALMQSSVHQSENSSLPRFSSGPLGRFTTTSGPISKTSKTSYIHSVPPHGSIAKSGPISGKDRNIHFYSGPLGKTATKSGLISGTDKSSKKKWWSHVQSPFHQGKKPQRKSNQLTAVGPLNGQFMARHSTHVVNGLLNSNNPLATVRVSDADSIPQGQGTAYPSRFCPQHGLLKAPPETLGAAALALHYANVIIVIEKLVASPHLIGNDARDDLYNMLPASLRSALRAKLKPYKKSLASSDYDTDLAGEWTDAMTAILEWLAPLAHNMIRWQSERSFEQLNFVSRTNVLLVQTIYFANLEKIEATITELLVGLNYIWRFGREVNAKALPESASASVFDKYLDLEA
ncbi:Phosphatase 2C 66 isoform 1 [Tripterygium wilfordii]|uniref:Phosphatase 2C 66 isoform 1 n=1 Tax=Tripterygium wilfordii TaxID=458696 RepID=A0A7J7CI35_TRIWF|nr:uncharacterized protein LOC119981013 [Tripterygium wilfordii]XP_038679877.1 uncharacterized protein LOC119981013 [Tripterygium wilfordii]KAF5733704.1 Phosphatase 2C 66 isoform 1 [Tripterygium wilfordii]